MDNTCFNNNGNCGENYLCFTQYNGVQCQCKTGFSLNENRECVDIDECAVGASCSGEEVCQNTPGGFKCVIDFMGFKPMNDGMKCPDQCSQGCENNDPQSAFESGPMAISFFGFGRSLQQSKTGCNCQSGFSLDDNGYDCIDIDECTTEAHGCSDACMNLDGSFLCLCPGGMELAEDGKNCKVLHQCYSCENETDPAKCTELETCTNGIRSCETKVTKLYGQIVSVSKGCKDQEKCANSNHNPINYWTPSFCESVGDEETCSCCCQNDRCNSPADCSVADAPHIACLDEDKPSLGQGSMKYDCTGSNLGDTCRVLCRQKGSRPSVSGHLVCLADGDGASWSWTGGALEDISCEDVDECALDNGGCQQLCVNTNGGHYCACYEDYQPERDAKYDLLFVVDTSDSVTNATWRYYTNFVSSVLDSVPISDNHVRAGLVTYSVDARWESKFTGNKDGFIRALSGATRGGKGQFSAKAAKFVLDQEADSGRRSGLHMVVIWLTDGRTSDSRLHLLDYSRRLQARSWCSVFAIGIGPDVSAEEMYFIGGDLQHYAMITDLDRLTFISRVPPLNEFLGIFLPGSYSQVVGENGSPIFGACGFNECEETIHGCSNGCIDKPNGYKCECPSGQSLGHDGKTCYPDACDSNPCAFNDGCHSNNGTATCFCGQFMKYDYVANSCVDYDECAHENGGCSHICTNQQYGAPLCSCPEGMVVEPGTQHCIDDPCIDHNCEHGCSVFQGAAKCACKPGYILDQDGRTCREFSRCDLDNGGCEFNCVLNSSPETFHCECPAGLQLREDGKTCGISCHTCSWATSEEECDSQGFKACGVSQNACVYEQRVIGNITYHSKGCQQPHACLTAQSQNSAVILGDRGILQCNDEPGVDSFCTFCCLGEMCNANYASYINFAGYFSEGCPEFSPPENNSDSGVEFVGLQLNENSYAIGARAQANCPHGTVANSFGNVNCNFNYDFNTHEITARWSADYNFDQAQCNDVDECQNSPCSQECQNLYGSHLCYCQADQEPVCDPNELDILFVVDQSENILAERFVYFKDFIKKFLTPIVIGDDAVRVGIILSADNAVYDVELGTDNSLNSILNNVRSIPCCAGQSNLGAALSKAAEVGQKEDRPLHVILLSDGLASDNIDLPAANLREVADHISAVGIFRANMNQMNSIVGSDTSKGRAILVNKYEELNDIIAQEVRQTFCPEGSISSFRIQNHMCEKNECLENNGGCQGSCHNTIGSYVCNCSHGKVLASDGHSCVPDYCREAGLNCSYQCINDLTGARCTCAEHFTLDTDGRNCVDLNECEVNNGGCQEHCVNLTPGYQCACYETKMLDQDQKTCIDDPCHADPTKQAVRDGSGWRCDCKQGYRLNELGICVDIDECQIDNWCQHQCINTIGGWQCLCPEGKVLRNDGKTCGIQCYHCEGAATNAECNAQPMETCSPDANSCQNEVRINHGIKRIFKRCKQDLACHNNYIQNPPAFLAPPNHIPEQSQCNDNLKKGTNLIENSVCRCCCFETRCNWAEKPCHVANDCSKVPSIRLALENSEDLKFDAFTQMKNFGNELLTEFPLDKTSVSLVTYASDENVILRRETEVGKVLDTFDNLEDLAFGGSGKADYAQVLSQLGTNDDQTTILVMSGVDSDVPLAEDTYVVQVQPNTTAVNNQIYTVNSYDQLSSVIPSLAENICKGN